MSSFRSAAFRWLLGSSLATYLGTGMQLTATAWLALDSGGAFGVGLVLAARMLPNLLFGLAAGTLADRGGRNRLLIAVRIAALPNALALAWLASGPSVPIWPLVGLSFFAGCVTVFDMPARQALVMDTVPREVAPNAMALNATAGRLCTALGAFIAGALIPASGVASAFLATALVYGLAAAIGLLVNPEASLAKRHSATRPSFGRALAEAVRMVQDVSAVRTLVLAAIACEVLGFSFMTAVPAFARDVLGAGAEGLGSLNAATSLGGAVAVIVLSFIPGRIPREPMLGLVFVLYGASLLALSSAADLVVASGVLLVTGACAALFDVLQQTLMQLAVPEEQRGRAVGIWVLGLGSAPLGNLEMGALVALLGAPVALAINGGLVLLAAAALLAVASSYRPQLLRAPG